MINRKEREEDEKRAIREQRDRVHQEYMDNKKREREEEELRRKESLDEEPEEEFY